MSIQSNPRFFSWPTVLVAAASFALVGSCKSNANEVAPESQGKQIESAPMPSQSATPTEPTEGDMAGSEESAANEDMTFDPAVLTLMLIDIDTELAVLCSLPESKVYFKHDSAKVLPQAKDRLDALATCAKSGPVKDRELQIVGRTDPSGSDEYNQKLGMSRADSVAKYLADQGVTKARVETESKGEATADENHPSLWPLERRVTIRLQD